MIHYFYGLMYFVDNVRLPMYIIVIINIININILLFTMYNVHIHTLLTLSFSGGSIPL